MVKSTTLCVISLIIFLFIGACATPTTQRVKVDDELAKKEAKKHHTQYQKMIRKVLDLYAAQYQKGA